MAGFASGEAAREVFMSNLAYASGKAAEAGMSVLIEPLNRHDAPGYFLRTTDQAADLLSELGAGNVKLMFDCYHVGRTEGDLITRLGALLPIIGHIQFAAVPSRGAPDHGEIDYRAVFSALDGLGWQLPLGAEYKPGGDTDASLGWMQTLSHG
jgi:hydroxypyruvate isomerase